MGQLRQLPRASSDHAIMTAASATLRIKNQKNGWKNVCINQEENGDGYLCPCKAVGRRYIHIRSNSTSDKDAQQTPLSAYFAGGIRKDVTDADIRSNLKLAATALDYPAARGIPIDRVDTHSLRGGGANALSLSGYSDRQIQKMGRWRSATFMEYIREELACFSAGMSKNMKRKFGFVNVAGGACHGITDTVVHAEYDNNAAAAA